MDSGPAGAFFVAVLLHRVEGPRGPLPQPADHIPCQRRRRYAMQGRQGAC